MKSTHRSLAFAASPLLIAAMWAITASGQTTGPKNPPLAISSMAGRDLFSFYCASCHGRDGKGDGPLGPALKTAPPDLTTLAKRHGGMFPGEYVQSVIHSGAALATPSHGSSEMPVWGPIFRALDANDARVSIRIAGLITHLRSIQAK